MTVAHKNPLDPIQPAGLTLETQQPEKQSEQWRIENHAAIQAINAEIAHEEFWSDGLRMF